MKFHKVAAKHLAECNSSAAPKTQDIIHCDMDCLKRNFQASCWMPAILFMHACTDCCDIHGSKREIWTKMVPYWFHGFHGPLLLRERERKREREACFHMFFLILDPRIAWDMVHPSAARGRTGKCFSSLKLWILRKIRARDELSGRGEDQLDRSMAPRTANRYAIAARRQSWREALSERQ